MSDTLRSLKNALDAVEKAIKAVKRVKNDSSSDSSGAIYTNARKAQRELEEAETEINRAIRDLK